MGDGGKVVRTGRGLANSVSVSKFVRFFVSHAALLSLSTHPAAPAPVHHPLANISLPLLEAAHVAREEGSLWPRVSARFQSQRRDEHARPNKASEQAASVRWSRMEPAHVPRESPGHRPPGSGA